MSGDGGGARRCDGAPRRSFVDGSMGRGGDRLRGRAGGGDRFVGGAAPSTRAGGTKGRKTRARGGGLAEKCADRAPVRTGGGDGGFGGGRGFGGGGRGGGARGRDRTKASRVVVWGSSAVDASRYVPVLRSNVRCVSGSRRAAATPAATRWGSGAPRKASDPILSATPRASGVR